MRRLHKLKPPEEKCCDKPDVKNEGRIRVYNGWIWEYHCFACGKTWTELQRKDCLCPPRIGTFTVVEGGYECPRCGGFLPSKPVDKKK